jgi:hypothetical protein
VWTTLTFLNNSRELRRFSSEVSTGGLVGVPPSADAMPLRSTARGTGEQTEMDRVDMKKRWIEFLNI